MFKVGFVGLFFLQVVNRCLFGRSAGWIFLDFGLSLIQVDLLVRFLDGFSFYNPWTVPQSITHAFLESRFYTRHSQPSF